MVDIHCHILPDFDDGSSGMEESLEMARMAFRSGVTDMATTSHFMGVMDQLERLPLMRQRFTELTQALKREQIPLRLHPGAEILCTPQTVSLAQKQQLPTIDSTNYLLTEFYFNETGEYMDSILASLAACGYRPVVAHPERYDAVQNSPELLEEWFFRGHIIQLNKGSFLGAFGPDVQQTAEEILRGGLAHVIASDAHSSRRRTTDMIPLRDALREICPERYIQVLLEENPMRLIRNQDMVPTE